jgi:GntR family transcriptional repressor for pyruvate dehydrogenase complex
MFEAAKSNKISDQIVDQIRTAIFEGSLKPGDRLPSEKELVETFQVSRATLREALRSLEVLGFLEIRKGASGGAFVVEMDMQKAKECLTNFLHFKNLSLLDLTEVRVVLESYTTEKAAAIISDESLKRLKNVISESELARRGGRPNEYRKMEIEFHRIIGSVTSNPILMLLLDFVENLLIDAKEILQPGDDFSERVQKAHIRIYTALSKRNAVEARAEMVRHVKEVSDDLTSIQQEKGLDGLTLNGPPFLGGLVSGKGGGRKPVF